MKGKHKRSDQIAGLIKRELSILFTVNSHQLHDERLHQVSIVDVEFPKGGAQAKVFYFIKDPSAQSKVDALLFKAKGFIRHYIAERVVLRLVPHLHFVYGDSIVRGAQVQSLIDQVSLDNDTVVVETHEPQL